MYILTIFSFISLYTLSTHYPFLSYYPYTLLEKIAKKMKQNIIYSPKIKISCFFYGNRIFGGTFGNFHFFHPIIFYLT